MADHRLTRATLRLTAFAVVLVACSDPPPPPRTTISYRFEWSEDGPELELGGLTLWVDGSPVGAVARFAPVYADVPIGSPLEGPPPGAPPLVSPRLEAEITTNCGTSRVPLSIAALVPDPLGVGPSAPMNVTLTMPAQRSVLVYVDRRGGGATTEVRVGATPVPLQPEPAGGPASRLRIGIGSCPGADRIVIGTSPPTEVALPADASAVFVDPTGERCYERTSSTYVAEGLPSGSDDARERFDRAFVHAVGPIDFLLTPAPDTVRGRIAAVRYTLAERPCGRR